MLSRFLLSPKISFNQVPLAFGKYKDTHKSNKEDSVIFPCLGVSLILIGFIWSLGKAGDRRFAARAAEKSALEK